MPGESGGTTACSKRALSGRVGRPGWLPPLRAALATSLVLSGIALPPAGGAAAAVPTVVETRVSAGSDDAEESDTGRVSLTSSDLELTFAANRGEQVVGVRLSGVVPQGSHVDAAYLRLKQTSRTQIKRR